MPVFEQIETSRHEQVLFCFEPSSGLRAIIAIHDTTLGPALGGVRLRPYESEAEALTDVLRLSRAMTYKAAVAGLGLGGGKAVIIGDPADKSEALMRSFGKYVNALGGRYITAEDVNTTVADMEHVLSETKYVCGISKVRGGSGDPSPVTATGVWYGIKASAEAKFGSGDMNGRVVAVQGLGKVGYHLARHLVEDGAKVLAADVSEERLQQAVDELGVEAVSPDEIVSVECDILAPCALGNVINDDTIDSLRCKVIAGAANNQLGDQRHGRLLEERGILYAPDFVINSGGLVNVYCELDGYNRERALRMCQNIAASLRSIFATARAESIPTAKAAHEVAVRRIRSIRKLRRLENWGGHAGR